MFVDERYFESGGLASYGTDNVDQIGRRGATYVDKILRGAKPADLPVEEPTDFRMALNLATVRKLKLTVPKSVLLRADLVIEWTGSVRDRLPSGELRVRGGSEGPVVAGRGLTGHRPRFPHS